MNAPAWGVALQILALALKHACAHFGCSGMQFAWVLDVFDFSERCVCADEVRIAVNEVVPFQIFGNGDWA